MKDQNNNQQNNNQQNNQSPVNNQKTEGNNNQQVKTNSDSSQPNTNPRPFTPNRGPNKFIGSSSQPRKFPGQFNNSQRPTGGFNNSNPQNNQSPQPGRFVPSGQGQNRFIPGQSGNTNYSGQNRFVPSGQSGQSSNNYSGQNRFVPSGQSGQSQPGRFVPSGTQSNRFGQPNQYNKFNQSSGQNRFIPSGQPGAGGQSGNRTYTSTNQQGPFVSSNQTNQQNFGNNSGNRNFGNKPKFSKGGYSGGNNRGGSNNNRKYGNKYSNVTYQKTIFTRKVTKTVKGGRNMSFYSITIAGNQQGFVGVGVGKSRTISNAIDKSLENAKNNMITPIRLIPMKYRRCATEVIINIRKDNVIHAPGYLSELFEAAGYKNVSCKLVKSKNVMNAIFCVFDALKYMNKINKMKEQLKHKNENDKQAFVAE